MASLRRRRPAPNEGGLTAAARRVSLTRKPPEKPSVLAKQTLAWQFYREVPEVKELVLWRGNQIAKLRLFPAAYSPDDPDGDPVPVTDEASGVDPAVAAMAAEVMADLKSGYGGRPELLRRLEINLEVAGELHLVGFAERPPDPAKIGDMGEAAEWLVVSTSELLYKPGAGSDDPGVYSVKQSPKDRDGRALDNDKGDDMFRIWMPDAEWATSPDNALMGTLAVLELVQVLNGQLLAESRSRIPAGILAVPNELVVAMTTAATANAAEGQEAMAEKFINDLVTAITHAITDPTDVATLAPVVVRGPKDHLGSDVFRWIDISRTPDEHLDKRIESLMGRVFRGLDAPVEVIEGHKNTTFSNANQIDEDTFEDYIEPRAVLVADALTAGYLRPVLARRLTDAGLTVDMTVLESMFVWYDPSDLVTQPNPSESASEGHDRYTISDKAWRRAKGFSEDDAPDPLEVLIRAGLRRGPIAPNVTNAILALLDSDAELPDPVGGGGNPQSGTTTGLSRTDKLAILAGVIGVDYPKARPPVMAVATEITASTSTPRGDIGRALVGVDREFRTRVLIAADRAMSRALEHAGNRLRSSTALGIREVVRGVTAERRAERVGPTMLAEAGITPDSLLSGAFDDLESQFMQWGAGAQDDAIELVGSVVGGFSVSQREALGLRMAGSLEEAWSWMKGSLMSLAEGLLFNPHPSAPAIGEFDPSLRIPPGLVRQAAARAGGLAGLSTNGEGSAFVTLTDAGTRPAGGIATGEHVRGVLRDSGAGIEGYEWEYGQARRSQPFHPHRRLDGVEFADWDDTVLSNFTGFPPYPFYMPGDHDGCLCDAIPKIIPAPER